MKRLIYFARDWKGIFCEFVIPILIIVLGMTVSLIQFIREPTYATF